jgi:hypothetical protein
MTKTLSDEALELGYKAMAEDLDRESEAREWMVASGPIPLLMPQKIVINQSKLGEISKSELAAVDAIRVHLGLAI